MVFFQIRNTENFGSLERRKRKEEIFGSCGIFMIFNYYIATINIFGTTLLFFLPNHPLNLIRIFGNSNTIFLDYGIRFVNVIMLMSFVVVLVTHIYLWGFVFGPCLFILDNILEESK